MILKDITEKAWEKYKATKPASAWDDPKLTEYAKLLFMEGYSIGYVEGTVDAGNHAAAMVKLFEKRESKQCTQS